MRLRLLLVAVLGVVSCTSDKAFVANSAAARIYDEDRYERTCSQGAKNPTTCLEWQAWLQKWKHANNVADEVQKAGALPAPERKEMKAVRAACESKP